MPDSRAFDVAEALAPVRRSLGMSRLLRWTLRGLTAGAAVAVVILAVAHFTGLGSAVLFAALGVILGLLAGAGIGIRQWPSEREAARLADGHFDLADRLTTALELRGAATPVAGLQRASAAESLHGLSLATSGRSFPRGREIGAAALSLVLVGALLISGPATSTSSAAHVDAKSRQQITRATKKLPVISRKIHSGLTADQQKLAALRKLDAALAKLRRQLHSAHSKTAALRAISLTQQQIQKINSTLHPLKPQAISQLNKSMSGSMTSQERKQSASSASALKAAARMLNRLSKQLAHMTPAQKAKLARDLARSANSTSDSALRSALQRAASSLAYNDPQSAAQALQQAAKLAQGTQDATAAQTSLSKADSSLESLKSGISGLNNKPGSGQSAPGTGKPGKAGSGTSGNGKSGNGKSGSGKSGSGKGNGKGSGKGQGNGKGSGKGAGQGKGQGQGQGNGSGKGTGGNGSQGGSGSHGKGGGTGAKSANGQGRYATVYVPGKERSGPKTTQKGPNGAPAQGGVVPYRQVAGSYTNQARAALGTSALTPSQRAAVQRYFSRISR